MNHYRILLWLSLLTTSAMSCELLSVSQKYTIEVQQAVGGIITVSPVKSKYVDGDQVILSVTPSQGYLFKNWATDLNATTNPLTVTINGNLKVSAIFLESGNQYTISIQQTAGGQVTVSPIKSSYHSGDLITISATPDQGFQFNNWSGDLSNSTNPLTVTINGNLNVSALFSKSQGTFVTGPGGGIVFYDKGSYSNGWRYLEVSASEIEPIVLHNWCDYASFKTTNVNATEIGSGLENTNAIVAVQGNSSYAASICKNFRGGGLDDWFLPSRDELYLVYQNLYVFNIGSLKDSWYWSSSEAIIYPESAAWGVNFGTGLADRASKNSEVYVRAVRRY